MTEPFPRPEERSRSEIDGAVHPAGRRHDGTLLGDPLGRALGRREREIMTVLWNHGSASVQQVCEHLGTALAYTTVMTTLDRLFKKGLLQREKRRRAFIYSARRTAREVEGQRAASLVRHFFSDSTERPEILLSFLVDAVHRYDTSLLDQLESKICSARSQFLAPDPGKEGGS